jgi:hypothetical protein
VGQGLGTGARQGYASELAGLWSGLADALARLEMLAADPEETLADDDAAAVLPGLQYTLHAASETVAGIAPPAGAEASHAELAAALGDARDATAEVAEALFAGGVDAAWPLVYEWRGALFRVRLARLRLAPKQPVDVTPARRSARRAASTALLPAAGLVATALGALAGLWEVAAGGLVLAAAALLARRS